jgi:hypothetical protein
MDDIKNLDGVIKLCESQKAYNFIILLSFAFFVVFNFWVISIDKVNAFFVLLVFVQFLSVIFMWVSNNRGEY